MNATGNPGAPPVVLYVEDEEDLLFLVSRRLEWEGYRVEKAMTREEAMAVLQHSRPSLAILDLMLPDGSGLSLLEYIRGHKDLKSMPVIILTGIGHTEAIEDGFVGGANAYLVKPVSTEKLLEAVHVVLAEQQEETAKPSAAAPKV